MAPSLIQDAITKAMFKDVTLHRIIAPTRPPNIHMDVYMADILNTIMVHSLCGYGDDIQGKAYIVSQPSSLHQCHTCLQRGQEAHPNEVILVWTLQDHPGRFFYTRPETW